VAVNQLNGSAKPSLDVNSSPYNSGISFAEAKFSKMEAKIRQDLPPPGGYRRINVERNPAKTYFRGNNYIFAPKNYCLVFS
jgi:GRIM-19 protein